MGSSAVFYILILVATCVISYMALQNRSMMARYELHVGPMVRNREWFRLVSSGFLHVDLMHLFVNMLTLVFAGEAMEILFGKIGFLGLYFGAMVGGSALAVFIHRNNPGYRAVGASGAISGLIYAFAVLFPGAEIRLFFILPIPAWLFAVAYTAYSLFGIRTRHANLGHEAHLGGGIIGVIAAIILPAFSQFPLQVNWLLVAVLLVPSFFFLYLFVTNPTWIYAPSSIFKFDWLKRRQRPRSGPRPVYVREEARSRKKEKGLEISTRSELEAEMNDLLELIHKRGGINKLTKKERSRLDELRQMLHGPSKPSGPGERAPTD